MNNAFYHKMIQIGVAASHKLISNMDSSMIYDDTFLQIYKQLDEYVSKMHIYRIDDQSVNFMEEVICSNHGARQGFDILPLEQLTGMLAGQARSIWISGLKEPELCIPIRVSNTSIGLCRLQFRCKIGAPMVQALEVLIDALAPGFSHVSISRSNQRIRGYFGAISEIIQRMQTINQIDELIYTFGEMTVKHMKLDRVTVFRLRGANNCAELGYCITSSGIRRQIVNLSDLILPLGITEAKQADEFSGVWFPLISNNSTIGLVLLDNLYSMEYIPKMAIEFLTQLCNQLAVALENIMLFTEVQHAAQHDRLTGLKNRAYFEDQLLLLDKPECFPISIIMGDLNGLKFTNDVFGHAEGDLLIKSISTILQKVSRPSDILARWGGDEFILLLPNTSLSIAELLCEKIHHLCNITEISRIKANIALGCSTKIHIDEDMKAIIKSAEDKMYRHKLLESTSFRSNFVASLKITLHEKCQETVDHLERMQIMAEQLGTAMKLTNSEIDDLKLLAVLHDIGKVAVNNSILNKPGRLDPLEFDEIKKHSEIGYRIAVANPELSQIADYILYHHERWDGGGYPYGKSGYEIPLLSRIIAVIDTYDVITHVRCYKNASSSSMAIDELEQCSGTQFDPDIVNEFVKLLGNLPNTSIKLTK